MTYDVESPGPGMAQAQTCGGANSVNGNDNTYISKLWTKTHRFASTQKDHIQSYHHKNYRQH
jgi:hypothetical protein